MTLYMWQGTYTPKSWAAQLKNPQNRVEAAAPSGMRGRWRQIGWRLVLLR